MPTLNELNQEALLIENELIQADGELTPELEARIDALLADGADKMDACAAILRKLDMLALHCREEASRLKNREASFERAHASLKARMFQALKASFGGKLKTAENTFFTARTARHISYECEDLDALEEHNPFLVRVHKSLDVNEIKQRKKCGGVNPSPFIRRSEIEGHEYLGLR